MSAAVRHCTPRTAHDLTPVGGDAGACYGAVGDMTRPLTVVVLSVALEVRRQLLVLGSVQVHEAVSNTGSRASGLGLRRGRSAHAPLVPLQRSLVRRSQPSTSPLRPSGVPNRSPDSPFARHPNTSQHRAPSHTSTTSTHPREIPANGAQTYLTDDLLGADIVGTCGSAVRGVASSELTVDKGVPDHDGRVVLSGDVRDVNASCKCASCYCMDGSVGSGLGKGRIDLFFHLFYAINPTPARPDFQRRLRGFHLYLPVTASPYSNSTTTPWTSRKISQTMLPSSELFAALKHVEAELQAPPRRSRAQNRP